MNDEHLTAVFVPWLHMHQPPIWMGSSDQAKLMGNLEKMLNSPENSEERCQAKWYAQAYKNPARYIAPLCCEGHQPRMMLDYSGVLLEELARLSNDGTFADLEVGGESIGDVIELFRYVLMEHPETIEFAGTAYSHCYFPTTPERDHEAQIREWRRVFADLFGEVALARIRGFWLPEMGISADRAAVLRLIRLLKKYGYEWLILPHTALEKPLLWSDRCLDNQVHWLVVEAEGDSERILCAVTDVEMGNCQQRGHSVTDCIQKIRDRGRIFQAAGSNVPPLIVAASEGEKGNGMMVEYFSKTFVPFFREFQQWHDIAFMTVSQYIDEFLPQNATTEVTLKSGENNNRLATDEQKAILQEIEQLSQDYARLSKTTDKDLTQAERSLLLCQTSCFVYGDSPFWLEQAKQCLTWAREIIQSSFNNS